MKSPSLNLDDPSTWSDELRKLVYTDQTWAILINDYNGSCEKFQELDFSPESLADPIVCSLRNQCEEIIRRQYETFSVFHASRTEHPNDYLKLGILTSSEERLTAQARELFNGIPNLDGWCNNSSVISITLPVIPPEGLPTRPVKNYADTPSALVVFCPVPPDNVISIISVEPITN